MNSTAPLADVRVLDLSRLLPGPFCSQLLADFGADVVKVEDVGAGDYARWATPTFPGVEPSAGSAFFAALNRGKRSVRMDLKHPRGREAFLTLVDQADVVLESFRPGVLDRLDLGHDLLLERNERLVICPISGYGQDGPYRNRSGHDLNYLAAVGLLDLTGDADGPPVQSAGQIADIGGAFLATIGILIALGHRDRTGQGQIVDISMAHGAAAWLGPLAAESFAGKGVMRGNLPLGGGVVCYRPYRCADGWVTLGALEPKFFAAFCAAVGRDDLVPHQFDPPGSAAHAALESIFERSTMDEWDSFAAEHDCCVEIVRSLERALSSELVNARDMVVELDQPAAEEPVRVLGNPLRLSLTPPADTRPVPGLGQHTDDVLTEAGIDAVRLRELHSCGAVAGHATEIRGSFLA